MNYRECLFENLKTGERPSELYSACFDASRTKEDFDADLAILRERKRIYDAHVRDGRWIDGTEAERQQLAELEQQCLDAKRLFLDKKAQYEAELRQLENEHVMLFEQKRQAELRVRQNDGGKQFVSDTTSPEFRKRHGALNERINALNVERETLERDIRIATLRSNGEPSEEEKAKEKLFRAQQALKSGKLDPHGVASQRKAEAEAAKILEGLRLKRAACADVVLRVPQLQAELEAMYPALDEIDFDHIRNAGNRNRLLERIGHRQLVAEVQQQEAEQISRKTAPKPQPAKAARTASKPATTRTTIRTGEDELDAMFANGNVGFDVPLTLEAVVPD